MWATAQTEPVPGYFLDQVAYCEGLYKGLAPYYEAQMGQDCSKHLPYCATDQAIAASNQDGIIRLNRYLTALIAQGGLNFVAITEATTSGESDAKAINYGPFPGPLGASSLIDRVKKCPDVVQELPY